MFSKFATINFLLVLAFVFFIEVKSNRLSWCDPELCPNRKQHIACGHDGRFTAACPDDAVMIDLRSYKKEILHEHNKRRNFVALGQLPGYYPASRMATMVWDEELAFLAALNLKMCYVEHDECNNTPRFANVGQNLSGVAYQRQGVTISEVISRSMGLWFGEYPLINSNYITKFRVSYKFEEYGHFAEFVVDRNTHVGCAVIRYTNPSFPFFHIYNMACNYASKYAIGVPVYSIGEPASECKTGRNRNYPGLCSTKEKYNPNYQY
ncbi:antigen 5 like allergen Cul n 1 [Bactrocera oleae]|uniref:antigen 5 like allergen Cul n 1 n=1 Tax=Bactrocera oleae TaxID=104688 RepID=UPI00174A7533|nr:antigen 5 like allergen Cul n 1 [Bactrocera oleae]